MSNLLSEIRGGKRPRASSQITMDDYASYFGFNGLEYPILQQTMVGGGKTQEILPTYSGFADQALKRNGIVFACIVARMRLFAEIQFKWRPLSSFMSADLFGTPDLALLEQPWPGGSTSDLLRMMSMNEQLAGNAYVFRESADTLRIPRPDFMTIVLGSREPRENFAVGDLDTEVIGYIYRPPGGNIRPLLPEQVVHWKTTPDPIFPWRGMSWLQPIISEIRADEAATTHKLAFFENGATANLVVTLDPSIQEHAFEEWIEAFEEGHRGSWNAYKTIYLGGGADAKVVGANMEQMDFKNVQSHGEVRVCNAAGIPPIIVGVSEGLDSATYSNYGLAKKAWADGAMRPDWHSATDALSKLVTAPGGAALWYDDRIPFLAEDQKDAAEIQQMHSATMKSLIDAGYKPDTVVAAVQSGDWSKLQHTGLYSVQLQPPGTAFTPNSTPPAVTNGNGAGAASKQR